MTGWTPDELTKIGGADELEVASLRRDGTLTNPRIVWVVRDGDELYVRSVNGPDAPGSAVPGRVTRAISALAESNGTSRSSTRPTSTSRPTPRTAASTEAGRQV